MFTIKIRNIKKMLILNSFRPPKCNIDNFFNDIAEVLQAIPKLNEYEVFITGDWNILYNNENSLGYKKIESFCTEFGLNQTIQNPTRCTMNKANILDLIITNCNHIRIADTSEVNLIDHQPVYLIRKKKSQKLRPPNSHVAPLKIL